MAVPTVPDVGMPVMTGDAPTTNRTPLLAIPPTVTTTLPVVAPLGTGATTFVGFQIVGVAATPLNVMVLVPCDVPKFAPVTVTEVPIGPLNGVILVIKGPLTTVNGTPLLASPPTVTKTFPDVAPAGTGTTILVALQLVGVAVTLPAKVTVLDPFVAPKFVPEIVTDVPAGPAVGEIPVMFGAEPTVKFTPLLASPPTVTTTFPVVAPLGTAAAMVVAVQLDGVADVPLNLTVLVPCVEPKFTPVTVTEVPTEPEAGLRLVMAGAPPLVAAPTA